ncbi:hypothetical protein [Collinsella tanakaei]|uniref:hypothetical protein n=1 Tax=Collinsella tanakaei TaxID=626935 RepID=UPI001F281CA5|nr:hypothetical protein [Collinsella tanakaei]MCF2621919.1 hypothetical protein [Collinsella tanakaei]MDM8302346.1 hypothetical protein [Collinsella tanakaei]
MGKRIPLSTFIIASVLFCVVAAGATYGIYTQVIAPAQTQQTAQRDDAATEKDTDGQADDEQTESDDSDDTTESGASEDADRTAAADDTATPDSPDASDTADATAPTQTTREPEPEPAHAFSCEYFYIDMPEGSGTLEVTDAGHEEDGFMTYWFSRTSGNGSEGGAAVYVGNEPHTASTTYLGTTSEGYTISASEAGAGVFANPDYPDFAGAVLTPL